MFGLAPAKIHALVLDALLTVCLQLGGDLIRLNAPPCHEGLAGRSALVRLLALLLLSLGLGALSLLQDFGGRAKSLCWADKVELQSICEFAAYLD